MFPLLPMLFNVVGTGPFTKKPWKPFSNSGVIDSIAERRSSLFAGETWFAGRRLVMSFLDSQVLKSCVVVTGALLLSIANARHDRVDLAGLGAVPHERIPRV